MWTAELRQIFRKEIFTLLNISALSYLATTLVLLGVYYITRPKTRGQYIMVGADCVWLIYSILTKQWALTVQSIILLKLNIDGVINFTKKGIEV